MKKVLYVVLKNTPEAYETLEELKGRGFNGTIVGSNSLRHALDYYPEEHHFLNLRHIESVDVSESVLCIFVWEESVIEQIKQAVREHTDNFKKIKGFMYSAPLEDYEGSD